MQTTTELSQINVEKSTDCPNKYTGKLKDFQPDFNQTETYLKALAPNTTKFTWQVVPAKWSDEKYSETRHGSLSELKKFLTLRNQQGYGIYIMVNESNFTKEKNAIDKTVDKRDFKAVRSVWIDYDKKDKTTEPTKTPIEPSIKVITSESNFHAYFICPELTPEEHQGIQENLVKNYDSDNKAKDLVRVLRVPGFLHTKDKNNLFLVQLAEASGKHYTREELLTAFPPIYKAIKLAVDNTKLSKETCIENCTKILTEAEPGDRHNARYRAGFLAGTYIAANWVQRSEMFEALKKASDSISDTGSTEDKELESIANGIAEGEAQPAKVTKKRTKPESDIEANGTKLEYNYQGKIAANPLNLLNALSDSEFCGYSFRFDSFRDNSYYKTDNSDWQTISDDLITNIRIDLCRKNFETSPKKEVLDLVANVCKKNTIDSAQDWLNNLEPWDNIPRVSTFLSTYWGVNSSEYSKAVSNYMWTGLVGRILHPGCKADMMLVLQGKQGVGKSTSIEALAPLPSTYSTLGFNLSDDAITRKLRGTLIAEIEELKGLHSKAAEHIKAQISTKEDTIVEKYKTFKEHLPRRCLFFGTTNEEEFLSDKTGNRRFLPFVVTKTSISKQKEDLNQLYAEALVLHKEHGVMFLQAERLAKDEHHKFAVTDIWDEPIKDYLDKLHPVNCTCNNCKGKRANGIVPKANLQTCDILTDVLDITKDKHSRVYSTRVGEIMRRLGYINKKGRRGEKTLYLWFKDFSVDVEEMY